MPFGSFSQAGLSVIGRDLPANLLNVLNPLTLTLGDLSTTAIGAMQSGSMIATVNTSGIVNHVALAATGSTTSANSLADAYGGIANAVAFQNIAVNSGDVNGSVQLVLADVNATVGKIGTTAIGAMGSGSLTATNTLEDPEQVVPREAAFSPGGSKFDLKLPANSFSVVRVGVAR